MAFYFPLCLVLLSSGCVGSLKAAITRAAVTTPTKSHCEVGLAVTRRLAYKFTALTPKVRDCDFATNEAWCAKPWSVPRGVSLDFMKPSHTHIQKKWWSNLPCKIFNVHDGDNVKGNGIRIIPKAWIEFDVFAWCLKYKLIWKWYLSMCPLAQCADIKS